MARPLHVSQRCHQLRQQISVDKEARAIFVVDADGRSLEVYLLSKNYLLNEAKRDRESPSGSDFRYVSRPWRKCEFYAHA
jgi:hypothetical protein